MSRLRVVPYRDLRRVAEKVGFLWTRCEGSHNIFVHPDGRLIVIPDHGRVTSFGRFSARSFATWA